MKRSLNHHKPQQRLGESNVRCSSFQTGLQKKSTEHQQDCTSKCTMAWEVPSVKGKALLKRDLAPHVWMLCLQKPLVASPGQRLCQTAPARKRRGHQAKPRGSAAREEGSTLRDAQHDELEVKTQKAVGISPSAACLRSHPSSLRDGGPQPKGNSSSTPSCSIRTSTALGSTSRQQCTAPLCERSMQAHRDVGGRSTSLHHLYQVTSALPQ